MSAFSGAGVLPSTWTHTTRTFQALGHRFAVRSTDAELGRLFDDLYQPCAVSGDPNTWYSIVAPEPGDSERELYVDGRRVASLDRPSRLVRWITWHVNHQVIASSSDYVLLHAAAAARDGVGLLLPAASEAGKTTLVAGLIRSGFLYLTDEAAAIDPKTLQIEPYPKPLSIDRGSWQVLADFAPSGAEIASGYHAEQWNVSPASLRPGAVSGAIGASVVVFPQFERGAGTSCEPVERSQALIELLRNTFRFHEDGRRKLEVLAQVLRHADCYRLVSGNLGAACEAVETLIGRAAQGEAGGRS